MRSCCRKVDLLLLEVDEEVKEFVGKLKDWSLDWLVQDGCVLLDLTGAPAGTYYSQEVVRFFLPKSSKLDNSSGTDDTWPVTLAKTMTRDLGSDERALPRHTLA